jgi:hypothetical protein
MSYVARVAALLLGVCASCTGAISAIEPHDAGAPEESEDAALPTRRDAGRADAGRDAGGTGKDAAVDAGNAPNGQLDSELLAAYVGNSAAELTAFETWLGRPVDAVMGVIGYASWNDFDTSVGFQINLWKPTGRRVLWNVPLIPTGGSLADAAAGKFDDHYRKAAAALATWRPEDSVLYVRTGWEFNGNWFPWTAQNKAADFKAAFQHLAAAFHAASPRFLIEWNSSVGDTGMNPEDAYPGDDVVDIIGMDFYWKSFDPQDPNAAWSSMVSRKYGLQWHQDFAAAHSKPTAYSEWGVTGNNGASYIASAKAWFAAHDVIYQTYWNSDVDYRGKLSSNQFPATADAYRATFSP